MPKESSTLTVRNKLYLQKFVEHLGELGNIGKARRKAYVDIYRPRHKDKTKIENASKKLHYDLVHRQGFAELLDYYLPPDEHAKILTDVAKNAKKDNIFQGNIVSSSPDYTNRLAALSQINNIKGYAQKQRNVEINLQDKRQTLIVQMDMSKLDQPDRPVEEIEAEFIAGYEKEQED